MIARNIDPQVDLVLKVDGYPGPTVVIPNGADEAMVTLAAGICAGYSKAPKDAPATVSVQGGGHERTLTVLGIGPGECKHYMI
jgi:hypothetical protein